MYVTMIQPVISPHSILISHRNHVLYGLTLSLNAMISVRAPGMA